LGRGQWVCGAAALRLGGTLREGSPKGERQPLPRGTVRRGILHPSPICGSQQAPASPVKVGRRFSFGFSSGQLFSKALNFYPVYCKFNRLLKTLFKAGDV